MASRNFSRWRGLLIPISLWISWSDNADMIAPLLTLARQAATYQAGIPTHNYNRNDTLGLASDVLHTTSTYFSCWLGIGATVSEASGSGLAFRPNIITCCLTNPVDNRSINSWYISYRLRQFFLGMKRGAFTIRHDTNFPKTLLLCYGLNSQWVIFRSW